MSRSLRESCATALALVVSCIVVPYSASATGFVTVGNRLASDGGQNIASGNNTFSMNLEAGKSYSCTVMGTGTGSNLDFSNSVTGPSGAIPAAFTGLITPAVVAEDVVGDNRISVTPTESGAHIFTVINADADAETGRLDCVETTLYGGYNTNVNDFNFLELLNTTNSTITGTITAVNFDGTVVINAQAFTVTANNRADVDIHTAAGADRFGLIRVSHNGPPGALQASVSQYSGTASDFELRASTPLRPRDDLL